MPIIQRAVRQGINKIKGAAIGNVVGFPAGGEASAGGFAAGVKGELAKAYKGSLAETVVDGKLFTQGGMKQVGAEAVKRIADGSNRNSKAERLADSPFIKAQMNPGLGQPQEQQAPIQVQPVMPQKMVAFGDHLSEAFESIM